MAKLYAVGDIHGSIGHLARLVEVVPFEPEDRIVFIGDYIDRGPDSRGTVNFLLEFREKFPNSVFLRGNHEDMFEDFLRGSSMYGEGVYSMNGGNETLTSYQIDPFGTVGPGDFPADHLKFLFETALMHREDGFLFVHAGIRPGVALEDQNPQDLLWIRDEFFLREHSLDLTVVFGHTPLREVFQNLPYAIGIDTGAVFGGRLTCVELAERAIRDTYQV
ncbi:MAG: metallophosphoesterase family protein [Nitrospinota bacterium]